MFEIFDARHYILLMDYLSGNLLTGFLLGWL